MKHREFRLACLAITVAAIVLALLSSTAGMIRPVVLFIFRAITAP